MDEYSLIGSLNREWIIEKEVIDYKIYSYIILSRGRHLNLGKKLLVLINYYNFDWQLTDIKTYVYCAGIFLKIGSEYASGLEKNIFNIF